MTEELLNISSVTLDEIIKLHGKADGLTAHFERIDEALKKILAQMQGNGDPSKGLLVRVDRLEQTEQKRLWLIKSALGAAIGAIVVGLASWFYHPVAPAAAPPAVNYYYPAAPAPATPSKVP